MDEIKPVAFGIPGYAVVFSAAQKELGMCPGANEPLYDQQAIDTLRAELKAQEVTIGLAREIAGGTMRMGQGLIAEYAARAERAEAEADALRKDVEGRWDAWLSHALSKWPEAEAALIATRVALGPTAPITQADIDFAKREAL